MKHLGMGQEKNTAHSWRFTYPEEIFAQVILDKAHE